VAAAATRASLRLADLDADVLLCVARRVAPCDWGPLALQCRALRRACEAALVERHLRLYGGDDPGPIRWQTAASSSMRRLRWAVDRMGYVPDERTLREIAFHGAATLFRKVHVRAEWGLRRIELSYDVYRHAGAPGDARMIREMLRLNDRRSPGDEQAHLARREMLFHGMVAYDRAEALRTFRRPIDDDWHLLTLVPECISAGSEQALCLLLDTAPAELLTRQRVLLFYKAAMRFGRAGALAQLHRRYGARPALAPNDEGRAALGRSAFPLAIDGALRDWTYFWPLDDFRPVDHMQAFRRLCEELGPPVPEGVVHLALRHGEEEAVEYIHRHHHPVGTWQASAWMVALMRDDDNDEADLRLVDFAYRLAWRVTLDPRLLFSVIRATYHWHHGPPGDVARPCVLRLRWLLDRNVPWCDDCVDKAVSYGATEVLEWMLRHGAPMDRASILEAAPRILEMNVPHARALFRRTVTFLLDEGIGAVWSASCIRIASDVSRGDDDLLRWMVRMGAPLEDPLLEPGLARRLRLRERAGGGGG